MAPTKKQPAESATAHRTTVTLDDDMHHLLEGIRRHTGFTPAQTIHKMLLGHIGELWEYLTHLESLPDGESPARSQAVNLLRSYGPVSLRDSLKAAKEHPWKQ